MMKSNILFDSNYALYVNNDSSESTLNRFLKYKESFSPNLFDKLTKQFNIKRISSVYDPFLGTGSIFLNGKIRKCYGEDVNPLSVMISNAKLNPISIKQANFFIENVEKINIPNRRYKVPKWRPYKKYVPIKRFQFVMNYLSIFKNTSLFLYVKMVLACNLDKIFNYKRDGNGIKYRKSNINDKNLRQFLNRLVIDSLKTKVDYQKQTDNQKTYFYNKSSIIKNKNISNINLIITSPPYCNMFSYFDIYKIELWTFGIVESYDQMIEFKKKSLRSNLSAKINDDYFNSNKLNDCIIELKKANCPVKTIKMIKNYFFDMSRVLSNCYSYLRHGSFMFVVVGNSFYKNKPVITDLIISDIAKAIGFKIKKIIVARKLKTSSQQLNHIAKTDKQFLRESIIVLRRE